MRTTAIAHRSDPHSSAAARARWNCGYQASRANRTRTLDRHFPGGLSGRTRSPPRARIPLSERARRSRVAAMRLRPPVDVHEDRRIGRISTASRPAAMMVAPPSLDESTRRPFARTRCDRCAARRPRHSLLQPLQASRQPLHHSPRQGGTPRRPCRGTCALARGSACRRTPVPERPAETLGRM
jgi:hypothetical protein